MLINTALRTTIPIWPSPTHSSQRNQEAFMGKSCFLAVVLLSAIILSLSVPQGYGRRIRTRIELEKSYYKSTESEESSMEGREMMEMVVMDYKQPGANNNTRNGGIFDPPPPPTKP